MVENVQITMPQSRYRAMLEDVRIARQEAAEAQYQLRNMQAHRDLAWERNYAMVETRARDIGWAFQCGLEKAAKVARRQAIDHPDAPKRPHNGAGWSAAYRAGWIACANEMQAALHALADQPPESPDAPNTRDRHL